MPSDEKVKIMTLEKNNYPIYTPAGVYPLPGCHGIHTPFPRKPCLDKKQVGAPVDTNTLINMKKFILLDKAGLT